MSLFPYFFNDPSVRSWWDVAPSRIYDQNFGFLGDAMNRMARIMDETVPYWAQSHTRRLHTGQSGMSEVINDKEKFQVNLDVSQFRPEEIEVKSVENSLVIEGKHEERMDEHGYVSRAFTRRYFLPDDVEADKLSSSLSADGILTIGAPKLSLPATEERKIPIQMGPKREAIKENKETPEEKK